MLKNSALETALIWVGLIFLLNIKVGIAKSTWQYHLFIALILTGLFSVSSKAEDTKALPTINLESVLVQGVKLPEDYPLNAPRQVTKFDREAINELGFTRAQDISAYVPNYNLMDAGANGLADRSNIRGLANTPLYTTPSVVLYIDDVPHLSSFAFTNQLVDATSIEVYRGPQGGLFGMNSYAGVINVISRKPSNNKHGNVSVGYGNFNSLNVDGSFSGALIKDRLYFSIGTAYSKRDGYLSNTFLNSRPDFQDHLSGKASLIWTPNTAWEVNFSTYLQDFNDGAVRYASLLSSDKHQTQSGEPGHQNQDANNQSLKISYQNDYLQVQSITTRRDTDTVLSVDLDLLPQPLLFWRFNLAQQQWSQEIRIKSLAESVWRWSFGLFFSDNAIKADRNVLAMQSTENLLINKLDETSYAMFGQVSYQALDMLRVFLDLRLDYVEKNINTDLLAITGQTRQLKDKNSVVFASPKLTIDYALSSEISTYISTGLAFRPGGFSAESEAFPEFDKETMWSSEIGVKSSWLNDRLSSTLALFYYDIKNYQLEEAFTPFDYTVVNVPETASYGAEMSFTAKITDTLKINGNFAYTQTEFDNYVDPFSGENFQGKRAPYVPIFNSNIAGIFKHPSGLYARTDLSWIGKTYFDTANSNVFSEQDYHLLNIVLGYEYKNLNVRTYVSNLTNTKYFTNRVARLNIGAPGLPRIFGARISLKF